MSFIPWWIHYPNVNNEILNLDWLLKNANCNTHKIENFINLNTIKYADPILWNITSQYEANTVVVDGQTGNAYISTKAVPSGVHLNRTEYWTQIYNYADALGDLRNQIAFDEGNTTTASRNYAIGDLVFVNELLYKVIAPMIAGDSFVVDSNIEKTTVEKELDNIITNFNTAIGDLNDLNTSNKDNLVEAINEVEDSIGDLNDLNTSNKDNLVEAINEVNDRADTIDFIIVASKNGAVGDGVADDTQAIQDLIDLSGSTGRPLFLDKTFKVNSLTITNKCEIYGTTGNTAYNNPNLIVNGTITIVRTTGDSTVFHNLSLKGEDEDFIINHATNVKIRDCDIWHLGNGDCIIDYAALMSITGCTFTTMGNYALRLAIEHSYIHINTYIDGNTFGGQSSVMRIETSTPGTRPEGIVFSNNNTMNTGSECFSVGAVYSLIISGNTLDQMSGSVLILNQTTEVINDVQLINNYVGMVGSNPNPIVSLHNVTKLTIRDNHFTGCERMALIESDTTNVVISGNMLESNDANYPAITVNSAIGVIITDNIIKKTGTGAVAIQCTNATGLSKVIVTSNIHAGSIVLNAYDATNSVNANNLSI